MYAAQEQIWKENQPFEDRLMPLYDAMWADYEALTDEEREGLQQ